MYDRRKDMTKKAWKELQKAKRATSGFNERFASIQLNKIATPKISPIFLVFFGINKAIIIK